MTHPAIEAAREALAKCASFVQKSANYADDESVAVGIMGIDALESARAALRALDEAMAKGETWWRSPTKDGFRWMREVRECAEPWCWRFLVLPFPEEAK